MSSGPRYLDSSSGFYSGVQHGSSGSARGEQPDDLLCPDPVLFPLPRTDGPRDVRALISDVCLAAFQACIGPYGVVHTRCRRFLSRRLRLPCRVVRGGGSVERVHH